ncbi:Crp/Fnr family transcriptional regulator [Camelliibacillus cellulosilyticus]|uniref:Crp/Fnr family transcriptional regulator n=1 Tax=Camelliibacillus cellulosilyticus TaxID=2174486 RepID=A0ABV9GP64_9BACL
MAVVKENMNDPSAFWGSRPFTNASLDYLKDITTKKTWSAGAAIYREGDCHHYFYMVIEGTVKLTKTSDDGTTLTLHFYRPGDCFGEMNSTRSAFTAEAVTPTTLSVIAGPDLELALGNRSDLALQFIHWQAVRQNYLELKLRDLLFHGKKGALASTLIRAANTYGINEDDGYVISRKLTNTELAELIGATRETVNRMLTKMKQDRLIEIDHGRIKLLDLQGIKAICHCENCPLSICRL